MGMMKAYKRLIETNQKQYIYHIVSAKDRDFWYKGVDGRDRTRTIDDN